MTFDSEFESFKSKFDSMLDSMRQIERDMRFKVSEVDERLDKLSEEINKHKNLRDELEIKNREAQLVMANAQIYAERTKAAESEMNQRLEKVTRDQERLDREFKILDNQRVELAISGEQLQKRIENCLMEERRLKLFELNLNKLAQDKAVLEKLQEISKK